MKRMTKIKLYLTVVLVFIVGEILAQEKSIERVVSEKLVTKIEGREGDVVSPDYRHMAYLRVQKKVAGGVKWSVVLDGEELKQYDCIGINSLVFSPDSKRTAYVALSGKLNIPKAVKGKKYVRISDIF